MKEISKNRTKSEQKAPAFAERHIACCGVFYRSNAGAITAGQTMHGLEEHSCYSGHEPLQVTIGNE